MKSRLLAALPMLAVVPLRLRLAPCQGAHLGTHAVVTLLALFGLPRISDAMQAVGVLCVTAFFLMWGNLYWSLSSLLIPARRVGLVGSLMSCAGSGGGILIPIITGMLLQSTGSFNAVIRFFSACALVYVIATLFIGMRRTR